MSAKTEISSSTSLDITHTVFMSYSWDSIEHRAWVKGLAERLRAERHVPVILDQWELVPGADRTHFMEQSFAKSEFVLVICTPTYAEKADRRADGVGYEAAVITGEIAHDLTTTKFIPVLRSGDWRVSSPRYLKSRFGIDLTGDPYSEMQFEQLVLTLRGQLETAPPLGTSSSSREDRRLTIAQRVIEEGRNALPVSDDLSLREIELLWNAVRDPQGEILHSLTLEGEGLRSNDRHFLEDAGRRTGAEWIGAFKKLEQRRFIEPVSASRDLFRVSDEGYAAGDDISDFSRWNADSIKLIKAFINADSEQLRLPCTGILVLPAQYYKDQVSADGHVARSLKEPQTLLIEGVDAKLLPSWEPTEVEFVDNSTGTVIEFMVDGMHQLHPRALRLPISGSW